MWSDGKSLSYKIDEQTTTIDFPAVDTFAAEVADFAACVSEKRRPINTEEEGINVLKVILGAYKSTAEKAIVSLSDI
jgi:predicted dehydrogenase